MDLTLDLAEQLEEAFRDGSEDALDWAFETLDEASSDDLLVVFKTSRSGWARDEAQARLEERGDADWL